MLKKIFLYSLCISLSIGLAQGQKLECFVDTQNDRVLWIDTPGQIFSHRDSGIEILIHGRFEENTDLPIWRGFTIQAEGMGCLDEVRFLIFLEKNAHIELKGISSSSCPDWVYFNIDRYDAIALLKLQVESYILMNDSNGSIWAGSPEDPTYWIKMIKRLKKVNESGRSVNR